MLRGGRVFLARLFLYITVTAAKSIPKITNTETPTIIAIVVLLIDEPLGVDSSASSPSDFREGPAAATPELEAVAEDDIDIDVCVTY